MSDYFDLSDNGGTEPTPLFAGHAMQPAPRIDPEVALRELHDEFASKLFNYTYSVLRCREDAEDAVQTTFMNAYGSIQDGRVPRQKASWLFRIAKNVCLNRIRTQQRKPSSTLDGIDVASSHSVDDQLDQRLHMVALRHALNRLPEQQCKAIVMREWQGASYGEIATALETTQGAVESLIFRARRQLATAMQSAGNIGEAGGGLAQAA